VRVRSGPCRVRVVEFSYKQSETASLQKCYRIPGFVRICRSGPCQFGGGGSSGSICSILATPLPLLASCWWPYVSCNLAAAASAVIFESQQLSLTLHIGAKMLLATCGKLLRRHEPTRAIYDTLDAPIWWAKKARPQTFVHNCVKS